jgi:hypothetical protein
MSAYSGKNAIIRVGSCDLFAATDWTLTYGSPNEEYFAVSGAGASQTVSTAERGSGTVNAVLDPEGVLGSVAVTGALVTLTLLGETTGKTCTGKARVGQIEITANVEGTPQRQNMSFMTHGAWTGDMLGL